MYESPSPIFISTFALLYQNQALQNQGGMHLPNSHQVLCSGTYICDGKGRFHCGYVCVLNFFMFIHVVCVQHEIVSGLKAMNFTYKHGIRVDTVEETLGYFLQFPLQGPNTASLPV